MSHHGVLHWIGDFLTFLDLLHLRLVSKLTKVDIAQVEMLHVSTNITPNGVLFALSFFNRIRRVMLQNGSNLDIHSLSAIAQRGVEIIEVHSFGKSSLDRMDMSSYPNGGHLHPCPLRQLRIKRAVCTGPFLLNALAPLRGLKSLSLENIHQLHDSDLCMIFEYFTLLEDLSVKKCMLLQQAVFPANTGLHLESLAITECPSLTCVIFNPSCSRLRYLSLNNTSITQDTIEHAILGLTLSTLDLSHCSHITSLRIDCSTMKAIYLRGCTHLNRIELSCSSLTDLDILLCQQLSVLLVNSSMIDHINLTMLTNLRLVSLNCSKLQTLNLSGCIQLNSVKVIGSSITFRLHSLVDDREKQIGAHLAMLTSLHKILPSIYCGSSSVTHFLPMLSTQDAVAIPHPRSASL